MKKIFVFIGSQAGKESKTLKYVNAVLSKTISKCKVEYDITMANEIHIISCKSCNNCFENGQCPLDSKDDMGLIKEKMLEADFIIFASPVYLHNVSGDMKSFIDRLAYWSHLMKLAGKKGAIISSSSGNGNKFVNEYLYKIMTYFGIKVVGNFSATEMCQEDIMKIEIEKFADMIAEHITCENKIESDKILEGIFVALKEMALRQEKLNTSEYRYWMENKYFEYKTFQDLLDSE